MSPITTHRFGYHIALCSWWTVNGRSHSPEHLYILHKAHPTIECGKNSTQAGRQPICLILVPEIQVFSQSRLWFTPTVGLQFTPHTARRARDGSTMDVLFAGTKADRALVSINDFLADPKPQSRAPISLGSEEGSNSFSRVASLIP